MEKKFRRISLIFIIGCFIFYGLRFVYYYIKFNKSSNGGSGKTISNVIQKNNEITTKGDGLYNNDGELVFKGSKVNNYLEYSNILWRIVKVDKDNSIVLITDSVVNSLAYDKSTTDFTKSNINSWLNESEDKTGIFETKLNNRHDYLVPNNICLDNVKDLNKITCRKKDHSKYITLLNVADYLNSKNKDSFINNSDNMWLVNSKDNSKVWYLSNGSISNDTPSSIYGIKPVVTLKNSIDVVSGNGTKEKPYKIEKENKEISFNSYVKLGTDLYKVYDIEKDTVKLVYDGLIDDQQNRYINYNSTEFNPKSNYSVAQYLNYTIYNKLTYKNNLIDCDYYVGDYNNDYKDVYSKKVTTKLGELSAVDVNTDSTNKNYFLLNKHNNVVMAVNDENTSITNKVKYTVCISKTNKLKGNGTEKNPFELEV